MTAWGVVAVCGIGAGAAGPFLDGFARRVRRPVATPAAVTPSAPVTPSGTVTPSAPLAVGAEAYPICSEVAVDLSIGSDVAAPVPSSLVEVPSSPRAVAVESVVVALFGAGACVLAAVRLGVVPQLAAYCVLAGALVTVSVTDLRTGLVPRSVVYVASAGVGVALLAASAADGTWRPMLDALVGAAVAFAVFSVVWWVSPRAMGFGDVRLAGLCGGALGWLGAAPVYLGFLAAFVVGTLMGLVVLLTHGRRRFPFAPALAVGTMFGVLWGTWLGNLWLHG